LSGFTQTQLTPSLTLQKITIGSVLDPGLETKLAITRSSIDRVKASNQPEINATVSTG
jgi:putrescine transport system permease protein